MSTAGKKALTDVLRRSFNEDSRLLSALKPGLQAMGKYSDRVREGKRCVTDSIDLDEATRRAHPEESRWDYVLGVTTRGANRTGEDALVAIEVHSARDAEIKVVIAKKRESKAILAAELRRDSSQIEWYWIASGKAQFSPNSGHIRRLAAKGITFVGGRHQL